MKTKKRVISIILMMSLIMSSITTLNAAELGESNTENSSVVYESVNDSSSEGEDDVIKDATINVAPVESEGIPDEDLKAQQMEENGFPEELAYLYVDEKTVAIPGTQNVVAALSDDDVMIQYATLEYKVNGMENTLEIESTNIVNNTALFTIEYSNPSQEGDYQIVSLSYRTQEYGIRKVNLQAFNYTYQVGSKTDESNLTQSNSEIPEVTIFSTDESGNAIELSGNSPENVIQDVLAQSGVKNESEKTRSRMANGNLVVAICAGHDGNHTGAAGNGLNEEALSLKVAQYCKAELEQYRGVSVYMVRNSYYCTYGQVDTNTCLTRRVEDAQRQGADLFVDIHFNAAVSEAYGAEVWYPNSSYNSGISQTGKEVADRILQQLSALGLYNRGAKIRNSTSGETDTYGTPEDYYLTNRYSKQLGLTGIIVEHAFLTNVSEANKLKNESFLQQLGVADATGIAQKYGLSKGAIITSPSTTVPLGNEMNFSLDMNQIAGGFNKFQFLVFDGEKWVLIQDYSPKTSAVWKTDKKGNSYTVAVNAKNDSGELKQYFSGNINVVEPTVKINGITVTRTGLDFKIKGDVLSDTSALKYQYLLYDNSNNVWTSLYDSQSNQEFVWSPKKGGDYTLCLVASTLDGKRHEYYQGINVDTTYINDISIGALDENGQIVLKTEADSYDKNLKYSYIVYDGNVWKEIKYNSTEAAVKWTPEKEGDYLLHLEVMGESGRTYEFNKRLTVQDGVKITSFTANKKSPQKVGEKITLTGTSETKLKGTSHAFIYFDGVTWREIKTLDKDGSVEWSPSKEGDYMLCYQLELKGGRTVSQFINYSIRGAYTQIKDINVGSLNADGQISLTANVDSTERALKYSYIVYDGNIWKEIKFNATEAAVKWTPEKEGNYLLHLEVMGDSGKTYEFNKGVTVQDDVKITSFTADKKSPQKVGEKITLSGISETKLKGTSHAFIYFDGVVWREIKTLDKVGSVEWSPSKEGDYMLCYQLQLKGGRTVSQFISYSIRGAYTQIKDINVGSLNADGQISLTANVDSTEKALKYSYIVYDGNIWKEIKYNATEAVVKWTPEKEGNYLLHLEVMGEAGRTYEFNKGVTVQDDVKITSFTANKKSPQKVGEKITLSGISETKLKGTSHAFIYFDGAAWREIKTLDKVGSVEWSPSKEGDYVLCYQLQLKGGRAVSQFINYSIRGVYTQIKDINVGSLNADGQISLTADVESTEKELKYFYIVHDGKNWKEIKFNSTDAAVKWTPEKEGYHMIHLEVKDKLGKIYQFNKEITVRDNAQIISFTTDKQSPQKAGTEIKLNGKATSYLKGSFYRYIFFDGNSWRDIKTTNNVQEAEWKPTSNGNYTLCFQVSLSGGRVVSQFIEYKISDLHDIMGKTATTARQLAAYFRSINSSYPSAIMANGGAPTLESFCQAYIDEANVEGIKAEIAFAQSMLETGFLRYGKDVSPEQFNFAGLGATGNGNPGNSFPDVRTGIRAHIQHLKCYASTNNLNTPLVDPRWNIFLRGKAPYIEWLSIPHNPYGTGWAADINYASKLLNIMRGLSQYPL